MRNLPKNPFVIAAILCGAALFAEGPIIETVSSSDEHILAAEFLSGELTPEMISQMDRKDYILSRREKGFSNENAVPTDTYLEGYIQGLVDVHYYELEVIVVVNAGNVYLYNLPKNELITNSIITFVSNLPDVKSVQKGEKKVEKKVESTEESMVRQEQLNGIWFPQSTVLFQPLIADLLEPVYSVGYRFDDSAIGNKVIGVSLGDTFPIFRWRDVFCWDGDLQIDIQAGVWSIFKMGTKGVPDGEMSELVNTDFLVGIPLSYAVDRWAFRFRVYHISSHLGDEFLVNNPGYQRVNPSMEAVDFFSSYQISNGVRLYFGPGWVFHSDETFHIKPIYVELGAELRMLGRKSYYHRIYGTPFIAVNFRSWQQYDWNVNSTYQIGYEWSKLQGVGRKVRLFGQYYQGFSEGQFFNQHTSYFSLRFSYGF